MMEPLFTGHRGPLSQYIRSRGTGGDVRLHEAGRGGQQGFSLLEVLVAVAILGIALTVVMQLFSANLRSIKASEDHVDASMRAEAKMREILDDEELGEKAWTETTDEGYRIDVSVTETMKERTETLQVALFEVTLAIRWKKADKERVQILRTLKVMPRKV